VFTIQIMVHEPASTPAAAEAVADATGAALQADMPRALAALHRVRAEEFTGADHAFRAAMLDRFRPEADERLPVVPMEPVARELLSTYRAYWRAALARPDAREDEGANLAVALQRLLQCDGEADMDAIEPFVAARFRHAGFHSLQGCTGPLRELMVWARQDERAYRVDLPDGAHTTRVLLLDDFASLGWGDYVTCGRRGAGGWATGDALYAVVPRYQSLDGEEFRVTFLGHETQHFSDLARFPGIPQWKLEYRAKLVEVAQARETRAKILTKFTEDQGDDPASPHAYANKRVLAALTRSLGLPSDAELGAVDVARLQAAAASELQEDTRRRRTIRPASAARVREGDADQ
jgi:hypothetical protein